MFDKKEYNKEYLRGYYKNLTPEQKERRTAYQKEWARSEKRKAYQKEWAKANKEKRNAYHRKWLTNNKEAVRERAKIAYYKDREANVRRVVEGVVRRRERKAGRPRALNCEICETEALTVFDHNHTTGEFRGWLCSNCNRHLGWIENNLDLVDKMKAYLSK